MKNAQKQKGQNGNKPLTLSQLERALAPFYKKFEQIDKRFEQIDERFKGVDTRFKEMGGWFQAAQSIHAMYTDRAIGEFEIRLNKKFDNIMSIIDAFLKRTEDNKQEITFLGRQHDDLAKYCTEKIAYPTYGRKM